MTTEQELQAHIGAVLAKLTRKHSLEASIVREYLIGWHADLNPAPVAPSGAGAQMIRCVEDRPEWREQWD